MKNRYFVISESKKDSYPIKVTFKDNVISFRLENISLIKQTDGFLICPKCKEQFKKLSKRKQCGKCRKSLKWNLESVWKEQRKIRDALRVLNKFFVKRELSNIDRSSIANALDFIERDKIDLLLKLAINTLIVNNVDIEKRFKKIEDSIETLKVIIQEDRSAEIFGKIVKSFLDSKYGTSADDGTWYYSNTQKNYW